MVQHDYVHVPKEEETGIAEDIEEDGITYESRENKETPCVKLFDKDNSSSALVKNKVSLT